MEKILDVAFCADNKVSTGLSVTIYSLLLHNQNLKLNGQYGSMRKTGRKGTPMLGSSTIYLQSAILVVLVVTTYSSTVDIGGLSPPECIEKTYDTYYTGNDLFVIKP